VEATESAPTETPPQAVRRKPRVWVPYLILITLGIALGLGLAARTMRNGALGTGDTIGSWTTGRDFGSADQSAVTRAIVALRGLLALPASEARYYNAAVDDSGAKLASNCRYRLTGGAIPARWWSVTLYDHAGYLVANDADVFSVGSTALSAPEQNRWTILVAPDQQPGRWLPTGGGRDPFELTLRTYLPADGGTGNLSAAQLPSIRKEGCV
jgi:hypothetical protein